MKKTGRGRFSRAALWLAAVFLMLALPLGGAGFFAPRIILERLYRDDERGNQTRARLTALQKESALENIKTVSSFFLTSVQRLKANDAPNTQTNLDGKHELDVKAPGAVITSGETGSASAELLSPALLVFNPENFERIFWSENSAIAGIVLIPAVEGEIPAEYELNGVYINGAARYGTHDLSKEALALYLSAERETVFSAARGSTLLKNTNGFFLRDPARNYAPLNALFFPFEAETAQAETSSFILDRGPVLVLFEGEIDFFDINGTFNKQNAFIYKNIEELKPVIWVSSAVVLAIGLILGFIFMAAVLFPKKIEPKTAPVKKQKKQERLIEAVVCRIDFLDFDAHTSGLTEEKSVQFIEELLNRLKPCVNKTGGITGIYQTQNGFTVPVFWPAVDFAASKQNLHIPAISALHSALMFRNALSEWNVERARNKKRKIKFNCVIDAADIFAGSDNKISPVYEFNNYRADDIIKPESEEYDIIITRNIVRLSGASSIAVELRLCNKNKHNQRIYAVLNTADIEFIDETAFDSEKSSGEIKKWAAA